MRWQKVENRLRRQPTTGEYNDWKPEIAEACHKRCVYCGIALSRYGGIDNYHVDHFRPKSLERFKNLKKVITNLYLACAICNRFKSNDWPNDPAHDHSIACYPDPGEHAYRDLFAENRKSFVIRGKYPAAKYLVHRLGLNRVQLIIDRRTDALLEEYNSVNAEIGNLQESLSNSKSVALFRSLLKLIGIQKDLAILVVQVFESDPYASGGQRRPAGSSPRDLPD